MSVYMDGLPITVTESDYTSYTGNNLREHIVTYNDAMVDRFLDQAHETVYNLIYSVGGDSFKVKLITANRDKLLNPIRRALVCQIDYMVEAGGDYGATDGSNITPDGTLNLRPAEELQRKILAPKIKDILRSARPNVIAGVE